MTGFLDFFCGYEGVFVGWEFNFDERSYIFPTRSGNCVLNYTLRTSMADDVVLISCRRFRASTSHAD